MKDLTGQIFGRLRVIKRIKDKILPCGKNKAMYLCQCICGQYTIAYADNLKSGRKKSCGCLRKEKSALKLIEYNKKQHPRKTHNKSKTRLYRIYANIKQRCLNFKSHAYKYYGARGIKICDEWLNDFMSFYNWAIKNGYKDDLTIDRINNDSNYEPNNCRWITHKKQSWNKRNNKRFTYNGEAHCINEWIEILGQNKNTINTRIQRGWDIEKALFQPIKRKGELL